MQVCEAPVCPAEYKEDPAEAELCALWHQLTDLEVGGAGGGAVTEDGPVDCPHLSHPSSAAALCQLWCDILVLQGGQCGLIITTGQ